MSCRCMIASFSFEALHGLRFEKQKHIASLRFCSALFPPVFTDGAEEVSGCKGQDTACGREKRTQNKSEARGEVKGSSAGCAAQAPQRFVIPDLERRGFLRQASETLRALREPGRRDAILKSFAEHSNGTTLQWLHTFTQHTIFETLQSAAKQLRLPRRP